MIKNFFEQSLFFFLVFWFFACEGGKPAGQRYEGVGQKDRNSGEQISKEEKLDPALARVELVRQEVVMMPVSQGSELLVPGLEISFEGADFIEILRCFEEEKIQTYTGDSLSEGLSNIKGPQARWLWQEALAAPQNCKIVANHVTREKIPDLAAPAGQYFYILNPCVSKERSINGRRGCSYNLKKSDLLSEEYEPVVSDRFVQETDELYKAEAEMAAEIRLIRDNALLLSDQIRHCEIRSAQKDIQRRHKSGLISLAAAAVGSVAGFFVGGPAGALQGGSQFMKIARTITRGEYKLYKKACKRVEPLVAETEEAYLRLETLVEEVVLIRKKMDRELKTLVKLEKDLLEQVESAE